MPDRAFSEVKPIESQEIHAVTPTPDNLDPDTETPPEEDSPTASIPSEEELDSDDIDEFATPPKSNRGWKGLMAGMGIGIVLAVGGMRFLDKPAAETAQDPPPAQAQLTAESAPSQTVTVATVARATVGRTLDARGTVQAYDLLPVLPQQPGLQIQQVLVDEGDFVKAGQPMAILDDALQRSQIGEAIAQLDSAESGKLERQAAVSAAEAALSQALASQSEAEAALSQALAAQSEAEAGRQQALAAKSEAQAAVSQAEAAKVEARAGREQAVANLAKAKAELAQAERELERYQTLAAAGAISQQELDTRRTTAENAKEAVRVAEANIKSADARIQSAIANISSMQARVSSAESNIRSAEARLESAIANVKSARSRLQRSSANVSSAEAQVESARANVSSAEANIRSSQARVQQVQTQQARTTVRAPAPGIVAERIARVGDITSNSKKLFSIVANNELEVHVKVPETQLPQVKIGAPATITSDADSRIQVRGTVRDIAPLVDEESRQATVKVRLPNNELLKPGMFLRAAITTSQQEALTVPAKAVLPQPDGSGMVYRVLDNRTVQAQSVEVGEITAAEGTDLSTAQVEIKSGLAPGDRLVVEGAAYLKDGDRIAIEQENPVPPNVEL
ncbi:efflux RND transporter periplasmic adaptor subunit [Phormidium sp. CCY1219]|uniref:efflux RND transporter periplasmic adaptor subunit n=1 Tax=Phormidium sp. CCY1219 TaxID=2886104 RepID=UPI002D1E8E9D|nr:efflux RND transporter periplasmic adaptor subunit [Phormidium sp. CCY1219]MEB3828679.1 efflux RND transporter periplasmic adaptor subunit [Phormidium sp. CCY1219]